jgi:hypothetical protein
LLVKENDDKICITIQLEVTYEILSQLRI